MLPSSGCVVIPVLSAVYIHHVAMANHTQYSQETATLLANQLLHGADSTTTIAVVSAPSVFVQLKNIIVGLREMLSQPNTKQEFSRTVALLRTKSPKSTYSSSMKDSMSSQNLSSMTSTIHSSYHVSFAIQI